MRSPEVYHPSRLIKAQIPKSKAAKPQAEAYSTILQRTMRVTPFEIHPHSTMV